MDDFRERDLGQVETYLRRQNPDLPRLRLIAQSHYSSPGFAFIIVLGVDDDTLRRRATRAAATALLQQIGYVVELEPGRDVYELVPERPRSKHEELMILSVFQNRIL
ncbi:hypothetical protein [Roseicyclus marinus]|uniref:hypothetical protein n=1 Tax=Roseicyclus marinus TaxID=2161673 RepID=UPI002410625E|nr:hypothetical protein [Roseicyclus marinus]MDG3043120.1 hypothetical protein [Roseicyclus marinus]